jgi:hypothetical protein
MRKQAPRPSASRFDATGGICLVSISALNSKASIKGTGELLIIEVEAVGAGAVP